MAATIFYRDRTKVGMGEKKPRFLVVAVADANVKILAKHLRKSELEQIAEAVGAQLVELVVEDKGHKLPERA
jgi:hypothetical protein